jgi:hypothetical protein
MGTVFRLDNAFIQLKGTDAAKVTFDGNKGAVGPALALKLDTGVKVGDAAPFIADSTDILKFVEFKNNAATREGGAVYAYLGDADNMYVKSFLTIDATTKNFTLNTAVTWTNNKAYGAAEASTSPNSGLFLQIKTLPTYGFRYAGAGMVAMKDGIPHIINVPSRANVASKLTFTYGDVQGQPLAEVATVTAWRYAPAAKPT